MPYYGNGLAQGVYFAGDQISRAIIERRRIQEAEARRAQQQSQWEAEHAIRQQQLDLQQATAARAAATDALQAGNPMDAVGLEGAILRGRPYAGVPYQVPASEMGPPTEGADLPTTEGPRLDPTAFTQPYQSTAELLATDSTAAAQAARLGQGTKRPVFGPQSTFGIKSPEQTRIEVEGNRRKDEARGRMTEAATLFGSEKPSERLAGLQLFMRALVDQDKLDPSSLKTVMELHTGERNAAANDGFLEAAAPQLSKMASGEPLNPDDTVAFGRAAWTHRRAPLLAHYFDELVAGAQAEASPQAKAILRYTQLRMADTPDKDAFAQVWKENPQGALLMLQPDAKGNLSRAPDMLRKDIEARAKLTGEDPAVAKKRTAEVEEIQARTGLVRQRTENLKTGKTEGPKTAAEARLGLDRSLRALETAKRDTGEDRDTLVQEAQENVDFWRGAVRDFNQRGGGKAETPAPLPSQQAFGELAPDQKKKRVDLVMRRLAGQGKIREGRTWEQLSAQEKAAVAASLK